MNHIRPFIASDIPRVIELNRILFPRSRDVSDQALTANLQEGFLNNPWYDPALPSLVCENEQRRVMGFLGVTIRHMTFCGRSIRLATSQHLMIHPESRATLPGVEMLRTFLQGAQDISMADMANDISRKLWERLGGTTSWIHSLHWTRILRPTTFAAIMAGNGSAGAGVFRGMILPATRVLDSLASRVPQNPWRIRPMELSEEPLDAGTLLQCLSDMPERQALRPAYDRRSLEWLFRFLSRQGGRGTFRAVILRNANNIVLGWYLYVLNTDGTGDVLQIGSRDNTIDTVIDHLSHNAWRNGAVALRGRIEPRFMGSFSPTRFVVSPGRMWMLVHSRDRQLLDGIHRGDAFLSRLEGDLWMV